METAVPVINPGATISSLMSIRIPAFLLVLLLAATSATRAQTMVVADATEIEPGFVNRNEVAVQATGVLTLKAPGTYTATSWNFLGELRLAVPGDYTLIAATGAIKFSRSSKIEGGREAGAALRRLTFSHVGDFSLDCDTFDTTIEISQAAMPVIKTPPLVNISTRVVVAPGQVHISGFVVGGKDSRLVLLRAIGPTLRNFGVENPLATPVLTVYNNQRPLVSNAGWTSHPDLEKTFAAVGAFPLPSGSRDAAMSIYLPPGSYTVQVGGGSGEVLLEIYHVE